MNPHEDNCATCSEVLCNGEIDFTKVPEIWPCSSECGDDIYEDDNGRWFHNDCMVADLDDYDIMIPAEE